MVASAFSGFQVWPRMLKYTIRIGADEMECAGR